MKHKNCMKCGKALKTLEAQQSGIGPECVKSVRQKILAKMTPDSKRFGLLDGEAERLLNELDYDIVMVVELEPYSSRANIGEIYWMDDTPPFFHKMEWEGARFDGSCISDAPNLAIANLLDRLGYQKTKNNRMFIIEEIWASHGIELKYLDKTEGCGIVDDLPCIVHLENLSEQEIEDWFTQDREDYYHYGMSHRDYKSELPDLYYTILHLFSEGFPEPIVKLIDEDKYKCIDFEEDYIEEITRIDRKQSLWYEMLRKDDDNLYSVGHKTVPNAYRIMERWVSENLENYIQRFIPPKDKTGFGSIVITAKNREQLMEDIEKELREITKTNDEWEFDGVKPKQFHSIANLMEELWLMRFWDDSQSRFLRVESKDIDKFVQSYLEQLNDKGDSLPAIETWH